jgi:hypothetical protein
VFLPGAAQRNARGDVTGIAPVGGAAEDRDCRRYRDQAGAPGYRLPSESASPGGPRGDKTVARIPVQGLRRLANLDRVQGEYG